MVRPAHRTEPTQSGHPTPQVLAAFVDGRLAAPDATSVEAHVAVCSTCCQVLSETPGDRLVALARAAYESPAEADIPEVPIELQNHPRYQVLEVIGKGGMGVVFRAEHRMMQRSVALKVINRKFTSNRTAIERFQQEVRSAAKLTHPNIVAAHDAEQAGELHFLVMEFVEGKNLAQWVQRRGVLTVVQACNAIRQVCLGLQHAHDHGMIHRDIKPQNLMLAKNGKVKILDFGLARLEQPSASVSQTAKTEMSLTAEGMLLGTPDFMAPEQAADASSADARSDIYSLGCTLFYLLAGRAPFDAGSFTEMISGGIQRQMTALKSLRSDLSPELNRLIAKMTAQQPEHRFRSAADVADALTSFCLPARLSTTAVRANSQAAASGHSELQLLSELPVTDSESPPQSTVRPRSRSVRPARKTPTRKRRDSTRRAVVTGLVRHWRGLMVGTAAGLLLIALGFALWDRDGSTDAVAQDETASTVPAAAGAAAASQRPRDVFEDRSQRSGSDLSPNESQSGTPAVGNTKIAASGDHPRVLFLVPSVDYWWGDISPILHTLNNASISWTMTSWGNPAVSIHETDKPVPMGVLLKDAKSADYDALVLTGGPGLLSLLEDTQESRDAERLIRQMLADGKPVAAITVGPAVLAKMGLLSGVTATGHERTREDVRTRFGISLTENEVERSGQIITGRDADVLPQIAAELLRTLQQIP